FRQVGVIDAAREGRGHTLPWYPNAFGRARWTKTGRAAGGPGFTPPRSATGGCNKFYAKQLTLFTPDGRPDPSYRSFRAGTAPRVPLVPKTDPGVAGGW